LLNLPEIRADFPILAREVRPGVPLVYLDSTATAQKPRQVIEAISHFYMTSNANIHRGVHTLAEEATALYEGARQRTAEFIGAAKSREIIFTRNTTESINLVASTWGRKFLQPGDVVVLTEMEHHANLVPWQMLAAEKDLQLEFITVSPDGLLEMDSYYRLLERKPRLVAFTHMSNVLGTVTPAEEIIRLAKAAGAVTLVDGAQSVPHFGVNVTELGADFLAFSAHKMCGPTGIGVLYGRETLLETMPPYMGGGDMIRKVELRSFLPNSLPYKFEAGTPAIAEAVGLHAAIDYLDHLGMEAIAAHEHELTAYAMEQLRQIETLNIIGPTPDKKGGVVTFTMENIHPHDVAQLLDRDGIAVRAGHHCAMPLHTKFCLPATTRASFYLYSTREEVDRLVRGLARVEQMFA
jgi:cysteine desulfurase/selenocysteine lyase